MSQNKVLGLSFYFILIFINIFEYYFLNVIENEQDHISRI